MTVPSALGLVHKLAAGCVADGVMITDRPARSLRLTRDRAFALYTILTSAPGRNRTFNLRIKSPLLCQLSYKGMWVSDTHLL